MADHECPVVDICRLDPVGTRFECQICNKAFILGPGVVAFRGNVPMRYLHEVFRRRPLEDRQPATWAVGAENGKKFIYMRCSQCGCILKTSADDVDPDGFLTPDAHYESWEERSWLVYKCITCGGCLCPRYAYLESWKEMNP